MSDSSLLGWYWDYDGQKLLQGDEMTSVSGHFLAKFSGRTTSSLLT